MLNWETQSEISCVIFIVKIFTFYLRFVKEGIMIMLLLHVILKKQEAYFHKLVCCSGLQLP